MRNKVGNSVVGLVPAAGMARRLNIDTSKEMLPVGGRPVIDQSIDNLLDGGAEEVVVVIRDGKDDLRRHLGQRYGDVITFAFQRGPIGNLLDAIKSAVPLLRERVVYFSMADTIMSPNPFPVEQSSDLTLLCFDVDDDRWQEFGVVDHDTGRIVDKPASFVGTTCWGALAWTPAFTAELAHHDDLTSAMNAVGFESRTVISTYRDVGTADALDTEQLAIVEPEWERRDRSRAGSNLQNTR